MVPPIRELDDEKKENARSEVANHSTGTISFSFPATTTVDQAFRHLSPELLVTTSAS